MRPWLPSNPTSNFDEAIRLINSSPYGLQAGIFTRDAKLMFQAFEELEVGGLLAGDVPTFRIDHMPYGGIKDSGIGREGLRYAIEEMTEPKLHGHESALGTNLARKRGDRFRAISVSRCRLKTKHAFARQSSLQKFFRVDGFRRITNPTQLL